MQTPSTISKSPGATPTSNGHASHAKAASPYKPQHHVRIVTAASLFDGHDAAINVMRRIMQASGAEVIHLGHNRSVAEIVHCAIQEDVQGIAVTSYQGGHVEYFKYMVDLLREAKADIKVFGGGGGTILKAEIDELHAYGVTRIYSPDDGRSMGLQGMIDDLLRQCDFEKRSSDFASLLPQLSTKDPATIGALITIAENYPDSADELLKALAARSAPGTGAPRVPVLGITGTGGAGKSSLVDELVRRFLADFAGKTIAVLSVDPSKRKSGGALLGDRIRMNSIDDGRVYMRSLATRQANLALSKQVRESIEICRAAGFDLIIVETSGIGQSDTEITEHADVSLYLMTAEYGAATQLEKIDMLDFADVIAINKFDKRGSLDALRDVKKQWRRNHNAFTQTDDEVPVFGTIASQFNDPGMSRLYEQVMEVVNKKTGAPLDSHIEITKGMSEKRWIIPPDGRGTSPRSSRRASATTLFVKQQAQIARRMYQLHGTIEALRANIGKKARDRRATGPSDVVQVTQKVEGEPAYLGELSALYEDLESRLAPECRALLEELAGDEEALRRREVPVPGARQGHRARPRPRRSPTCTSPSRAAPLRGLGRPPDVAPAREPARSVPLHRRRLPAQARQRGSGAHVRWRGRSRSAPTSASTTCRAGLPAKRLSTAFDSVTLYGEDPDHRPDIYGKVGNSGVSIASVDDAKKLYSGFDLASPSTSVSMTINGPAPMLLGFFLNAAIDQQCEKWIKGQGEEKVAEVERSHRGHLPEARRRPPDLPGPAAGGERRARPDAPRRLRRRGAPRRGLREDQGAHSLAGARDRASGHPQGGPGAEHLHLLHRVRPPSDGRHPAVLHRAEGAELLLGRASAATTSPRPGRTR